MRQAIRIEGMGCEHCVKAVREALESVNGVRVEQVEIGGAVINVEPDANMSDKIDEAVRGAGYEPIARAEA